MEFDKMSRGQQFLHLLRLEYQNLLRNARLQVLLTKHKMELYAYEDEEETLKDLEFYQNSIKYYSDILKELEGAENEEILTDSLPESESLNTFKGITCITVG